jgi:hypothetical protein
MTPGVDMEKWLNRKYGEDSALYQDLARLIKLGIEEGWAANQEVDGPNYRRSRIAEPMHFSVTAVYMSSADAKRFADEHDGDVLRGQFHGYLYGEVNLVVPLDKGAELRGLQGLDRARSRQPALSGGKGWRPDCPFLSARGAHLLRLQATGMSILAVFPGKNTHPRSGSVEK